MVNNTVNATYVETYDLNTAIGEMSMLGVHTPQARSLKMMYKGLFEQYKRYKILGCDIAMVCASTQNLTPDLVGLEAGEVDPRDVLNPILFRACTGETINALVDKIYDEATADVSTGSVDVHREDTASATNILATYYNFLADDQWRKAHPQSGLIVKGLKPYVHRVVTTQPFKWNGCAGGVGSSARKITSRPDILGGQPDTQGAGYGFGGVNGNASANPTVFVSNGLIDMPWLDTTYEGSFKYRDPEGAEEQSTRIGLGVITDVPKVWMGAIILPPAILQRLFFRMQIRWHIAFKDFRPAFEVGPIGTYATNILQPIGMAQGAITGDAGEHTPLYHNIYHSSTNLKQSMSSFDCTSNAEITTVNEKAL